MQAPAEQISRKPVVALPRHDGGSWGQARLSGLVVWLRRGRGRGGGESWSPWRWLGV